MKRREFIAGLSSSAVGPVMALGQHAIPVIGFLSGSSLDDFKPAVAAFRQGLKGAGYVEGKNVVIEYRWAQNKIERLPELAADLVRQQVTVIVAPGSTPRRSPPKTPQPQFPSCSVSVATRSEQVSLLVSTDQAGMSPELATLPR